jgi:hypothetical protein
VDVGALWGCLDCCKLLVGFCFWHGENKLLTFWCVAEPQFYDETGGCFVNSGEGLCVTSWEPSLTELQKELGVKGYNREINVLRWELCEMRSTPWNCSGSATVRFRNKPISAFIGFDLR